MTESSNQKLPENFINSIEGDFENHLFFNGELNDSSTFALITYFHTLDMQFREEKIKDSNFGFQSKQQEQGVTSLPGRLIFHFTCRGGSVVNAFTIADVISSLTTPVDCIIEGGCVASGIIVMLACNKRAMLPHANLYPLDTRHTPGLLRGCELKTFIAEADKVRQDFFNFISKHTNTSIAIIKKWFSSEKIIGIESALKYNFINSTPNEILNLTLK